MKQYLLLYLLLLTAIVSVAQVPASGDVRIRRHESNVLAGFNLGAAAPIPFPNTIRKIDGWWPRVSPAVGFEYIYLLPKKWGIGASVKLDYKAMGTRAEVIYFPTIISVKDGDQTNDFTGTFSGKNETRMSNAYITVPVYGVYQFNHRWKVRLGMYVSWLFSSEFEGNVSDGYIRNGGPTGEKVNIDVATFDFGDEINSFDTGLYGSGDLLIARKLSASVHMNWGLRPLFPSSFQGMDFPLHNIFGTLGVTYHLQ